jgi:hypothetical protein
MYKKILALACALLIFPTFAQSQELWDRTFVLDIRTGSSRSEIATSFARGGYELDDGTPVDLGDWYTANFPDFNVQFLTSLDTDFGVIWGFSTGERGEKYRIHPGFWLGFIYRYKITTLMDLSLSAVTMLGGDFIEYDCVGDWPAFGGEQKVNCRLAATPLPPRETLRYLVRERGFRETRATLRYEIRF